MKEAVRDNNDVGDGGVANPAVREEALARRRQLRALDEIDETILLLNCLIVDEAISIL